MFPQDYLKLPISQLKYPLQDQSSRRLSERPSTSSNALNKKQISSFTPLQSESESIKRNKIPALTTRDKTGSNMLFSIQDQKQSYNKNRELNPISQFNTGIKIHQKKKMAQKGRICITYENNRKKYCISISEMSSEALLKIIDTLDLQRA